jgi:glyoxylase I family protein
VTEDLRETLLRYETALASANPAGVEGGLASLIADGFVEFGASGRTWDAASMHETLAGASPTDLVVILAFQVVELAPDVALATYRIGPPRPSNRSTLWCRRDGRWQVRFHQGTLRAE